MKVSNNIMDFLWGLAVFGFLMLASIMLEPLLDYIVDLFDINSETMFLFVTTIICLFFLSVLIYVVEYKRYFILLGFFTISFLWAFMLHFN